MDEQHAGEPTRWSLSVAARQTASKPQGSWGFFFLEELQHKCDVNTREPESGSTDDL